jgi:hypothetical protein
MARFVKIATTDERKTNRPNWWKWKARRLPSFVEGVFYALSGPRFVRNEYHRRPGRAIESQPVSAGHRQGRASPRGPVPSGGLHRHQLDWNEPGRRPLLQRAWDGRAVDQGGQGSHPLDPALLPPLRGHRGPPAARGDRLQPRQSAALPGLAGRHPELVPDDLQQRLFKTGARLIRHCASPKPVRQTSR